MPLSLRSAVHSDWRAHDEFGQRHHPCYKYGHFLEEAVTRVLDDQEGVDVRVLIIDDASPDDCAEVARKIAARDPRVEMIAHEINKENIATSTKACSSGPSVTIASKHLRVSHGVLSIQAELFREEVD